MAHHESIELPASGMRTPSPSASRNGPFVFSGAVAGRDPVTRELPTGLDGQVVNVFSHVRVLMFA
ncbi:MAG: hypothetical protein KF761_08070 [Salinibacterium sp.]|nr:hypothetical protein [Salinibacterium sp.]